MQSPLQAPVPGRGCRAPAGGHVAHSLLPTASQCPPPGPGPAHLTGCGTSSSTSWSTLWKSLICRQTQPPENTLHAARLPARARAMPGLPPPHGLTARNAFREQCWFPSPHPGKEGGPQDACHNSGALPITAGPAGCRGKALQAPHHTGCLGEGRPTLPAKGPQHPVLPAHSHAHTHRALHCSGPRQPQPWDPAPPSQG